MADLKAAKLQKAGLKAALTKLHEYILDKLTDPSSSSIAELEWLKSRFEEKQNHLE